jgi:hypothetical protein
MDKLTFSGNGILLISGFFSGGSAESSCLMRFDGVGDDGSSSALRLPSKWDLVSNFIVVAAS